MVSKMVWLVMFSQINWPIIQNGETFQKVKKNHKKNVFEEKKIFINRLPLVNRIHDAVNLDHEFL